MYSALNTRHTPTVGGRAKGETVFPILKIVLLEEGFGDSASQCPSRCLELSLWIPVIKRFMDTELLS